MNDVKPGHNRLAEFADRLDALDSDRKAISDDIRDVKTEAKSVGIDPRALLKVVKEKQENTKRRAARLAYEESLDEYRVALGLID